jgi:ATP-dependent Clp protease ATP-binding subunit ClpA
LNENPRRRKKSMVQDLIIASRRMASLYRFKFIQPAHLLHAMTSHETGKEIISKAGYDVVLLRAAMIREFKAYASQVRDTEGHTEPSDLFDRCAQSYLDDDSTYETALQAVLDTIKAYAKEDRIVSVAFNEADMTRGVAEPRPDEVEFYPGIDDFVDEDADMTLSKREASPEHGFKMPGRNDRAPDENDPFTSMRSAYRDNGKPTSPPSQGNAFKKKVSKEVEEAQAAVRAAQRDLSQLARDGALDPVVGRDAEIDQIMEVLLRRRKPNVILVAEPGVGKSALVEGLAQRMARSDCPDISLASRSVREVSLTALVAGSRFRGDFESRMTHLIKDAEEDRSILFIDEIHMLVGSGAVSRGGMDGANILKPALARDGLSLIGATTPDEAMALREDRALMRRFEIIYIDEPRRAQMRTILDGAAAKFLEPHGVKITSRGIERLLDFGERYVDHRRNPDRSFDLLDLAAVSARIRGKDRISDSDLRHAVTRLGGFLPTAPGAKGAPSAAEIDAFVSARVKGQSEALSKLCALVAADLGRTGTARCIRLTGAEGLGKTFTVRTIADKLGKRLVEIGFEDSHPEAFDRMWNRMAMILEADPDSVFAIQGANGAVAARIDARLAGEVQAGALPVPILRSPLIFCLDGEEEAQGIGFHRASEEGEKGDRHIAFHPLEGEDLLDVAKAVEDELVQLWRDAGIKVIQREQLRALLEEGVKAPKMTYSRLKQEVSDRLDNV